MLSLLMLAVLADEGGFVAHGALGWLTQRAAESGCDLPAALRRLLDAHVVAWGSAAGGYRLQMQREFAPLGAEASRVA